MLHKIICRKMLSFLSHFLPFYKDHTVACKKKPARSVGFPMLAATAALAMLLNAVSLRNLSVNESTLVRNLKGTLPSVFASSSVPASLPLVVVDWQSSKVLPSWMKEYFAWHAEQLSLLNKENWDSHMFFVVRCLTSDLETNPGAPVCGGTSDRLHPMPMYIRIAAELKRIFLIKWERPARLEEFLIPPPGGLNWSVPTWLDEKLMFNRTATDIRTNKDVFVAKKLNKTLVDICFTFGGNHGSDEYDRAIPQGFNESTFEQVYRELWLALFQPSPPVQVLIDKTKKDMGLTGAPDEYYNAMHVRSQFLSIEFHVATNATNCGLGLDRLHSNSSSNTNHTKQPMLYVATDAPQTTRLALQHAAKFTNQVKARNGSDTEASLHMDRGDSFLSKAGSKIDNQEHPEDYYDTFVDLYMLMEARCLAYGRGSFGLWASRLSKDPSCFYRYFWPSIRDYVWSSPVCDEPALPLLHVANHSTP